MTFRAKTNAPKHRSTHDQEARQRLYVTVGFVAVIAAAIGILIAAVAVSYYNEHLQSVVTVDGQDVSRDAYVERVDIELFRITEAEKRVREALASGEVSSDNATTQLQLLAQQREQVGQTALDGLIDEILLAKYAAAEGVTVSDAELEAAVTREASRPELRETYAVFVRPEVSAGEDFPTPEQAAAAKATAERALAELQSGADFGAVAAKYSSDISKENGGRYGSLADTNPTDDAWVKSLFALESGGTTEVIEGADGTFRIGRVTEITPAREDPGFRAAIEQGPGIEAYTAATLSRVLQEKLDDKLVAEATKSPVEQIRASEIFVEDAGSTEEEARAAHILYSPKDDPAAAAELPADDPAWAAAKAEADAAVAAINGTPVAGRSQAFADLAESQSDDTASGISGGDLGWFTRGGMVEEFGSAVFDGDHAAGDIIGPVKSQFGYHVIRYDGKRPPAEQRAAELLIQAREAGADFAALAREHSDGLEALKGGDLGWIAPGQSQDKQIDTTLFALQPGAVSEGLKLDDGYHIYRAAERATRPLTPEQINKIGLNAFDNWYQAQKAEADIERHFDALSGL
ncbi:MAG TPA: peptidylprolyl isomerase [Candidatus Limnocylindrales bacterium]